MRMSSHATGLVQLRCIVPTRNFLLLLQGEGKGDEASNLNFWLRHWLSVRVKTLQLTVSTAAPECA